MTRLGGVLIAALCLVLTSCGITVESSPRPLATVNPSPAPSPTGTSAPSPSPQVVTLWFVRGGQLASTLRNTSGPAGPQDLIDLLVAGPTEEEEDQGLRTSVVSVVSGNPLVVTAGAADLNVPGVEDGQVAIVLLPEFKDLIADEQVLVLGEVVTTVAVGEVAEVIFVDEDGLRLGVPLADGRLRNGPVTPEDYAALIE